jgi:hypothetical protein
MLQARRSLPRPKACEVGDQGRYMEREAESHSNQACGEIGINVGFWQMYFWVADRRPLDV